MAGTTKAKLLTIFQENILARSEETKQSDFAAMDVGAFFIGAGNRDILIDFLAQQQAAGDYKLGLVPTIADKTIFFADIDQVPPYFDFDLFLALVVDQFNILVANTLEVATVDDVLVFKREDAAKYHIYIPGVFGKVSKAVRQRIWKEVNDTYLDPIIDEAAHTIRIEGFEKYCKETKQFIAGSRYLPMGDTQALTGTDLFKAVWLNPRGWSEKDQTVVDGTIDKAVAGNDKDNDEEEEKAESVDPTRDGSLDIVKHKVAPEIERRIKSNYSEIAHILLQYPITSIRRLSGGQSTFMLDKSVEGRTCKIANRVHTKNNTYLWYYQKKQALYQKCFSSSCTNKAPALIHQMKTDRAAMKQYDLPTPDDASVAEYFLKWNPLLAVERKDKKNIWYVYEEKVGYWRKSASDVIMRMMMMEFRQWISDKFDAAIKEADVADEELLRNASAVDGMLNTVRTLRSIAESVRWQLARDDKIEWNTNPCYTVFPNGVLQVDKRDEANPELYYFGKTKPEEYVNNSKCMKLAFNCPPLCTDGHYIDQAKEIIEEWIKKIQPVAEDKRLLLTYLSLILEAINYKKMILNIGYSGDNAKSSFFEMGVHLCGSYALIGDKCLLVKGKKDRVSKAQLNELRLVLFEEPDPSKGFDVEFAKDLVGGATETVGRFNFSNDNHIKLHCKTVLNANTMTTVQLESAIMNRLLYLAWTSQFVKKDELVDEERRVYKADPKFKTKAYWESVNDGFIWLLLNHYRLYELNGCELQVSTRQAKRTKAELLENDLFISWFKENFVYLADTPANRTKFVTQQEVLAQFKLLPPKQQQQIIGQRNYAPAKYVKDMMHVHSAFKACFRIKITNWRLSAEERKEPAAKNKTGPNCQYQSNALVRFVTRAEFEATETLVAADLATLPEEEAKSNFFANQQQAEEINDDYIYSSDMFFEYMRPVFEDPDEDIAFDVENVAELTGSMSLDIDESRLMTGNNGAVGNLSDENYGQRRPSLMSYSGAAMQDRVTDNVLNENDDNGGNSDNVLMIVDEAADDDEAIGNLLTGNNENKEGNDNVDAGADAEAGADSGADATNDGKASVKDQAAKPMVSRRKRKISIVYKKSKYGGSAEEGSAKKKRKL